MPHLGLQSLTQSALPTSPNPHCAILSSLLVPDTWTSFCIPSVGTLLYFKCQLKYNLLKEAFLKLPIWSRSLFLQPLSLGLYPVFVLPCRSQVAIYFLFYFAYLFIFYLFMVFLQFSLNCGPLEDRAQHLVLFLCISQGSWLHLA